MKQEIPWKKLAAEAFVIVGSILLAFSIDAWWDERQLGMEEVRLLQNLQLDFMDARELLAEELPYHTYKKERAVEAVRFGNSERALPSPIVFEDSRVLVRELLSWLTIHPNTGTLDGAISSGRLEIITNDRLRSSLAEWPQSLAEFSEQESQLIDLVSDFRLILIDKSSIAPALLDLAFPSPEQEAEDTLVNYAELNSFMLSDIGMNYMAMLAYQEGFAERDGELLLAAIDEILMLLATELE